MVVDKKLRNSQKIRWYYEVQKYRRVCVTAVPVGRALSPALSRTAGTLKPAPPILSRFLALETARKGRQSLKRGQIKARNMFCTYEIARTFPTFLGPRAPARN